MIDDRPSRNDVVLIDQQKIILNVSIPACKFTCLFQYILNSVWMRLYVQEDNCEKQLLEAKRKWVTLLYK